MSAGAVYNYFRTKDDLIASGIVSSTEETADLIKAVAISEDGPRAFRDVIGFFLADLEQARADGRAKATPMVHAEVSVKPALLQKFKEGRSKIREALTEQVGVMRPELGPEQCARLASFVYTLYEGMVASAALEEDLDVEAMAGIIDLVLTQYSAR
jgi:AcrR family transcriptional regulator